MALGKVVTLVLALCALGTASASAAIQPRIVGGSGVSIADYPYQAALIYNPWGTAYDGQFCGGTIRDATHIVTAGHCVFDNPFTQPGQVIDATKLDVLVGTASLSAESSGQRIAVASVAVHPDYNSSTVVNDAALLTLASPIALGSNAEPLALETGAEWAGIAAGTPAVVSGWGAVTPPPDGYHSGSDYPDGLRAVSVSLVSDTICNAAYAPDFDAATMVCAGEPQGGKDACQGDSGGPLALKNSFSPIGPADRLIGIVSTGYGCAYPGLPGIYTEVAAPGIRSFLKGANPSEAPVNTVRPVLTRTGDTLTCAPGTWTDGDTFAYQFARDTTALTPLGDQTSYTIQPGDPGGTITCYVKATGPNGIGWARSNSISTVVAPQPDPNPMPPPTPTPTPTAPTVSQDINAPVARIVAASCSKQRRCTLSVKVTDAGFSTGIKAISVKLVSTYRTTCLKRGKRVACTKTRTRTLAATRTGIATFRVVASGLPVGAHRFTVFATDNAGHRQLLPAVATLRTKAAAKRRAG
jgi:secreted trypsin-like serine protease